MREIKFRAWDKVANKMVSGHFLPPGFMNNDGTFGYENSNGYVIMQFTGIKDVKGEDLYEGDIIDVYDTERDCCCKKCFPEDDDPDALDECEKLVCRQEVKWSDHAGYFCEKDTGEYCPSLGADELELERVGDIYENPDLLV